MLFDNLLKVADTCQHRIYTWWISHSLRFEVQSRTFFVRFMVVVIDY